MTIYLQVQHSLSCVAIHRIEIKDLVPVAVVLPLMLNVASAALHGLPTTTNTVVAFIEQMSVVVSRLQSQLAHKYGLFCIPFNVRLYNQAVAASLALPTFQQHNDDCLAVMIGNTKDAWIPFIKYLAHNHKNNVSSILTSPHPFDNYITKIVRETVLQATTTANESNNKPSSPEIRFGYETGPGRLVAMQKLAHAIGFGYYNQECFTVIHPTFGPWFALRAVVVFPEAAITDLSTTATTTSPITDPCAGLNCTHAEAFQRAMSSNSSESSSSSSGSNSSSSGGRGDAGGDVKEVENAHPGLTKWLPVRDACNVGKEYRYPQSMIQYHYTHNKQILVEEVKKMMILESNSSSSSSSSNSKSESPTSTSSNDITGNER